MAFSVEAAWYFEGSGVPVGWNEGAVAFKDVVPSAVAIAGPCVGVAIGAMFDGLVSRKVIGLEVDMQRLRQRFKSTDGGFGGKSGRWRLFYDVFSLVRIFSSVLDL